MSEEKFCKSCGKPIDNITPLILASSNGIILWWNF